MAKKVFRLHENGSTDGTGWFISGQITSEHLESIKTKGKEVATSIPTPFARIDLVKTAFQWVADNGICGDTAHHRLVSEALDVAQLFYTYPKFQSSLRIISMNPKERFKAMQDNGSKAHKKYADTLELFWEQDSVFGEDVRDENLYNFEHTRRLYFLLNKDTNEVIGGTSPASLFFSAPDAIKNARDLNIRVGEHQVFGENFASLAERDYSFVKYFFALSKQSKFSAYFPEIVNYLEEIKNELDSKLKSDVNALNRDSLEGYERCLVLDNQNDTCEILGIPLCVQNDETSLISDQSDFVINSDYPDRGDKPLVLPQQPFSKDWAYTSPAVRWDKNTQVPEKNGASRENSRLPDQNDSYYWLTIGNFFEDKIIELPYPIDDSKFVTCGTTNYLLPLSETFFKYFEPGAASTYLTLNERSGGSVFAELVIPVRGGTISFTKQYSSADKNIEKLEAHLAIFPFCKSSQFPIHYKVGVLDHRRENNRDAIELRSFNEGLPVVVTPPQFRSSDEGMFKSFYSGIDQSFDCLTVNLKNCSGAIVPKLPNCSGSEDIRFAVDFGTTNTHIEFKVGKGAEKPLDTQTDRPLWQSLLNRNVNDFSGRTVYINNESAFDQEIFPFQFNERVKLPVRTAQVRNMSLDLSKPSWELIEDVNNYFLLDEKQSPRYLKLDTNIKWVDSNDQNEKKKVRSYIRYLLTLIYNKTLLLGGDPEKTRITWFYPVSMSVGEKALFQNTWDVEFMNVFGASDLNNIISIPESIAPYLSNLSSTKGVTLTMDIGGGSSDIAVFENGTEAKLISSFKFAGNAIFGDGFPYEYSGNSNSNGFVKSYKDLFLKSESSESAKYNLSREKYKVLEGILDRKDSADFSSFLFSLSKDETVGFDYSEILKEDKRMKLPIFIFYAAIAYYSAQLLKRSGIGMPNSILFSGTASKSAEIINISKRNDNISPLLNFIIKKVYDHDEEHKLKVILSENPKELTCKGALNAEFNSDVKADIKFWSGHFSDDNYGRVYLKSTTNNSIPAYSEILENSLDDIETSIKDFYGILDEYMKQVDLNDIRISAGAYEVFKSMREDLIQDLIVKGCNAFRRSSDQNMVETLFFYPLIEILNHLGNELSDLDDYA